MKRLFKNNWEYVLIGIIGIFIITVFTLGVNFQTSRADSGWDSDYDSGGGWSDSGGSWDSSDSWSSSGYDYDSYSGGSGSDAFTFMVFVIIVVIIIIVMANNRKAGIEPTHYYDVHNSPTLLDHMRQDISNDEIKEILPDEDLGSLKHMAYNKFIAIQEAWMDFNYDMLRVLCTDELYNSYVSQLDTLKIKNGKNIMTAFNQEEIRIIGIKEENKMVTVKVYLRITFYDYVINNKTKEVIRGNKEHPLTNNYEMEFVRKQNTEKRQIKCPNCGAEVNPVVSSTCEYCGSTIVVNANEFVLSKKTNINKY